MENSAGTSRQASMLPNLLILGAAKSGSSSLHRYLAQHPDVFMSQFKEPTFFVWEGREYEIQGPGVGRVGRKMIKDLDSYLALFAGAGSARIRGEASTGYLHTPGVAERIRQYVPRAKLIAILRNPIERAYSAFLHARRSGFEPIANFEQALQEESRRVHARWIGLTLYVNVGMYAEQLERYLAVFPCEQIRVYLFDDLPRDSIRVAQDAFRFLGVSDAFEPDVSTQANRGAAVRNVWLHGVARTLRSTSFGRRLPARPVRAVLRMNVKPKEQLSGMLRDKLAASFEADVARLSRLLGRDVSAWLEAGEVPAVQSGAEVGMHPCG